MVWTVDWEECRRKEREACAQIADKFAADKREEIRTHDGSQKEKYGAAWQMEMAEAIAVAIRQRTT